MPSTMGCKSASTLTSASLTKISFCACATRMAVLGTAQALRLCRRIEIGLRAIRPDDPPQRRFKHRTAIGRRHRQQSALPLHHDRTRLTQGGADQGDARIGIRSGHLPNPFGPGTGLAESSSGADQPYRPVSRRRQLFGPRPQFPEIAQLAPFLRFQFLQKRFAAAGCQFAQPGDQGGVIHRPASSCQTASSVRASHSAWH